MLHSATHFFLVTGDDIETENMHSSLCPLEGTDATSVFRTSPCWSLFWVSLTYTACSVRGSRASKRWPGYKGQGQHSQYKYAKKKKGKKPEYGSRNSEWRSIAKSRDYSRRTNARARAGVTIRHKRTRTWNIKIRRTKLRLLSLRSIVFCCGQR